MIYVMICRRFGSQISLTGKIKRIYCILFEIIKFYYFVFNYSSGKFYDQQHCLYIWFFSCVVWVCVQCVVFINVYSSFSSIENENWLIDFNTEIKHEMFEHVLCDVLMSRFGTAQNVVNLWTNSIQNEILFWRWSRRRNRWNSKSMIPNEKREKPTQNTMNKRYQSKRNKRIVLQL